MRIFVCFFFHGRLEPKVLPWQHHRCYSVSYVMYISGVKFNYCFNISGDIPVFSILLFHWHYFWHHFPYWHKIQKNVNISKIMKKRYSKKENSICSHLGLENFKNYKSWACNCSACGFTIFQVKFYQTISIFDNCTQDCRNYLHNKSRTF